MPDRTTDRPARSDEHAGVAAPVRVASADPARIRQVVTDLVHNAVKLTEPGGQVRVTAEQRGDQIAVAVSDDGFGIAPELLLRLFERIYEADRARRGGGTGLSLAITKHLVEAHAGRIWAESAGESRGATFTFVLPLARPTAPATDAPPDPVGRSAQVRRQRRGDQ